MQNGNENIENNTLQFIKGVGPKRAEALIKEGILTPLDLLYYFPRAYIDRTGTKTLYSLVSELKQIENYTAEKNLYFNSEQTIVARIVAKEIREFGKAKKMLSISLSDNSGGSAKIIFWNSVKYFDKIYHKGQLLAVSGKAELDRYNLISFTHPDIDVIDEEDASLYSKGAILPKYKLSDALRKAGISMKIMRQIVAVSLKKYAPNIVEVLPPKLVNEYNLPSKALAVYSLHFPKNKDILERSKLRIKFEELFMFQLFLNLKKDKLKSAEKGIAIKPKSLSARKLYEALPFDLTPDQKKVLREIAEDMENGKAMNRLLQGDVGSGKTIVAIFTMLMAIDSGLQVAFMAPTEILAEQHYHSLKKFLADIDIKVIQLVGGQKARLRRDVLEKIETGYANVIVGTHALFQSEINYNRLGLVIIDEQHRFGVSQRADLINLARRSFNDEAITPHILVMTATPIPRTLTMTAYGDLDVSVIKTKPKNRKPILTKVEFESNHDKVFDFVRSEILQGRQAFIVFPFVEKSEKLEDIKAATEYFEPLQAVFPEFKLGLLHGQMFWYEKEEAMQNFLNKEYDILVATTVIEVGIDIPNASVMVIENAERFGLSQLHQLRGRVGRGANQSYCILMTKDNYKFQLNKKEQAENSKAAAIIRLKTMTETTDGFAISEVDLRLRGPGDILGTKQAGLPDFKYADLVSDGDIMELAKKEAIKIISEDPHLRAQDNRLLRAEMSRTFFSDSNFFDIA